MTVKRIFLAGVCIVAAPGLFVSPAIANDKATEEVDAIRLAPSSKWNVHFDDDSCRLARFFGEGDERTLFTLERYAPGDAFSMVVAGKPLSKGSRRGTSSVEFGSKFAESEREFTLGYVGDFKPALIFRSMSFDPALSALDEAEEEAPELPDVFGQRNSPEDEGEITWIKIRNPRGKPVYLETGSLADPMKVMRNCTDDMMKNWGIDLAAHAEIAQLPQPKSEPGQWLLPRDYPTGLLARGYQGLVQVRLSVDPNGSPSACHIQKSTRPAEFDKAVCKGLMRRARFEPAVTKTGQPIASFWRTSVRFQIG